ncbi:DUF159 family protein [Planctomycetia bacterium]|nr:DUF159 family protein [Planctomycetia bacterium]
MCGRFTLRTPPCGWAEIFATLREPTLQPRSDICPQQDVLVLRCVDHRHDWASLYWKLTPSWSKTQFTAFNTINATVEKVATSGTYRNSFQRRRCLIPADGWYEWKEITKKDKDRYFFRIPDQPCFAFAGLWDRWASPDKKIVHESCTIITTEANPLVASIHKKARMPVILRTDDYGVWMDHTIEDATKLLPMLQAFPETEMEAIQVPRNLDNSFFDPRCWPHLAG